MSWFTQTLNSSLGKKVFMSFTGIFLITFLVAHLVGNLQLLYGDEGAAFNAYAKFMTSNPLIRVVSIVLYASIIVHVVWSIILTLNNKKARPVSYAVTAGNANSVWASRNMGILGTFILIFLVIHLKGFWYEMHFGSLPMVNIDGIETKDLYSIVAAAYSQWWYVAIYVVSMVALGFHLSHGFASAFQSLGLNHNKYSPAIDAIGKFFSILIPLAFAAIPVIMYLQN